MNLKPVTSNVVQWDTTPGAEAYHVIVLNKKTGVTVADGVTNKPAATGITLDTILVSGGPGFVDGTEYTVTVHALDKKDKPIDTATIDFTYKNGKPAPTKKTHWFDSILAFFRTYATQITIVLVSAGLITWAAFAAWKSYRSKNHAVASDSQNNNDLNQAGSTNVPINTESNALAESSSNAPSTVAQSPATNAPTSTNTSTAVVQLGDTNILKATITRTSTNGSSAEVIFTGNGNRVQNFVVNGPYTVNGNSETVPDLGPEPDMTVTLKPNSKLKVGERDEYFPNPPAIPPGKCYLYDNAVGWDTMAYVDASPRLYRIWIDKNNIDGRRGVMLKGISIKILNMSDKEVRVGFRSTRTEETFDFQASK